MQLITGGSGFFGTNLALKLLEKGEEVTIFDIAEPVPELKGRVKFIRGNVLDYHNVLQACVGVDTVFHTVALVPLSKAGKRFDEVNVQGTEHVCLAAKIAKVRKFVHISSSAVYDISTMPITESSPTKPFTQYGKAKLRGEQAAVNSLKSDVDYIIIRPRTILGNYRGGIFQMLYEWVYEGRNIPLIGDGKNLFQLISADDLAEACYSATQSPSCNGEIINIGNDDYGTLGQLYEDLIRYAGRESHVNFINATIVRNLLRWLDKLGLSPLADWHYLTMDKPFYFDTAKAKKLLKWHPQDSNVKMVCESYDWYVKHRKEIVNHKGTTHRLSPKQGVLALWRWFA